MQPIFCSFVSGVAYRKTVKLYFRSISRFDLLVSIYEGRSFRRFSSFLTAGNKSYYGTLQHLTHPQQSTTEPIPTPASSPKRQVSQRKPCALSSVSTQTSSHLRKHRTSVPSTPVDPIHTSSHSPRYTPNHTPDIPPTPPSSTPTLPPHPKVACNSRTGVTQQHKVIRTSKLVRGIACETAEPEAASSASCHPARS